MQRLRSLNRVALGACIIVMCAAVSLGIISRYVVGRPLLWTDEVARLMLVWLTFIGAAQLFTYQGGHLSLTMMTERLRADAARWVACATSLVELVLMAVIGIGAALAIYYNPEQVTSALLLPVYVVYGVIILASLASVYFILRNLIAHLRGKPPDLVPPPAVE